MRDAFLTSYWSACTAHTLETSIRMNVQQGGLAAAGGADHEPMRALLRAPGRDLQDFHSVIRVTELLENKHETAPIALRRAGILMVPTCGRALYSPG